MGEQMGSYFYAMTSIVYDCVVIQLKPKFASSTSSIENTGLGDEMLPDVITHLMATDLERWNLPFVIFIFVYSNTWLEYKVFRLMGSDYITN